MRNRHKKIIKTLLVTSLIAFAGYSSAMAQLGGIGAFLRAGKEDATILTREYLKPFPTGFGTALNAGWSETAAPKKTLGFSLQIRPSIAMVPSSDQKFDISTLNLDKIELAQGEDPITPTIAGSNSSGPEMIIKDENGNELTRFNMPAGSGVSLVPAPIVQAGLGLVKNTDVTVRFLPKTDIGDYGSFNLIGGAVKHELTQWLPGNKLIPVDISLMIGFNRIGVDGNLDLQPEGTRDPNDPNLTSNPTPDFNNQQVNTTTNTFVMNVLVGKTLPFISVYGGVGFQRASFDLKVAGDYPVSSYNPITPTNDYVVLADPISFDMDSKSNVHMLGGFRLKLGFLSLYGEATLANYFTANAGVGISFR